MATCTQCNNEFRGISSLFTFNRQTGRCKNCEIAIQKALIRFRVSFLTISSDCIFTLQKLRSLSQMAASEHLDMEEALAFIRADALKLLERNLDDMTSRQPLTDETEKQIRQIQSWLGVPNNEATHFIRRLKILNIYRGKFPIVPQWQLQDIRFEPEETCHLLTSADYHKVNATSIKQGRLVATNKKLRFLSATGGFEIVWNSVMSLKRQSVQVGTTARQLPITTNGIYLEANRKAGNGFFEVPDPEMVEAIIDTLVRMAKRQIIIKASSDNNRYIPQEVKAAVWQRDQGKCVQCGATDYLEFDHIIPYSKGGANTVNNVQLLCRKCNLVKSNRI